MGDGPEDDDDDQDEEEDLDHQHPFKDHVEDSFSDQNIN